MGGAGRPCECVRADMSTGSSGKGRDIKSSASGYDFAKSFVTDAVEAETAAQQKRETAERRQAAAQRAVEEAASVKNETMNYDKWSALNRQLELEEEEALAKAEAEKELSKQKMAAMGCAHDHTKERLIYEKSSAEKIRAAERFRLEGNSAFKEQNYGLAAVNFRKALLQFDYCFPEGEEETKWSDSVKLPCHLNLAACKLHQGDWEESLIQCRLALEIDPRNCKAYYRRGIVHLKLDLFDQADEALNEALKIEPTNVSIRKALETLQEKRSRYKRRNKQVYSAMLAQCKDDKDVEDVMMEEPAIPDDIVSSETQKDGTVAEPHEMVQQNVTSKGTEGTQDQSRGGIEPARQIAPHAKEEQCGAASIRRRLPKCDSAKVRTNDEPAASGRFGQSAGFPNVQQVVTLGAGLMICCFLSYWGMSLPSRNENDDQAEKLLMTVIVGLAVLSVIAALFAWVAFPPQSLRSAAAAGESPKLHRN